MPEKCPTCNTILKINRPIEINQSIICPMCGLEQVVIWLYPLELTKVLNYNSDPSPDPLPKDNDDLTSSERMMNTDQPSKTIGQF